MEGARGYGHPREERDSENRRRRRELVALGTLERREIVRTGGWRRERGNSCEPFQLFHILERNASDQS